MGAQEPMRDSHIDFATGLLGVFVDLLRALDAKGVLPAAEARAAFKQSFDAVPEEERDHPKHAVLRFLIDGLGEKEAANEDPAQPAPRPGWLRGVIDNPAAGD
jgi:hypothetical protein